MKKIFTLILIVFSLTTIFGQDQNTKFNKYVLRYKKASQDTVFYKIKIKKDTLNKDWILTEKVGDYVIQRMLKIDTIVESKIDTAITLVRNWKISEVKYEDKDPNKLYLNPYTFYDKKLNSECYLKIPENSYVVLVNSFVKWNAITIPFAIRPGLSKFDSIGNKIDSIGSKITTDLKIGASFSYNYNFEFFRNRRIKAKRSVIGLSGGIGFGLSKVTLTNTSTSLLKSPYENEEDGIAFFIAPGIGINLKGFQIAGFIGWDIGLTDNVNDWNYNKEMYFGIGLGTDLSVFGKK